MNKLLLLRPKWSELKTRNVLASYTRNSIAYTPAGVQANSGVHRQWDLGLKGGEINIGGTVISDAVFIEEASAVGSNLFPSGNDASFGTPWTSGVLNGTYTVSISGTSGSIALSGGASGTVNALSSLTFTVASSTITFTPTGSPKLNQLELRGYKTSYMPSAVTRSADSLSVNLPQPLQPYFTVVGAFAPNWSDATAISTNRRFFRLKSLNHTDYLDLYVDAGLRTFAINRNTQSGGSEYSTFTNAFSFSNSRIAFYGLSSTTFGVYLWLLFNNGTLLKTSLTYKQMRIFNQIVLGSYGAGGEANAFVLPPRILNGYQCTTDAQATTLIEQMKKTYVGGTVPTLPNNTYRLTPTSSCTITWKNINSNTISTTAAYNTATDVTSPDGAYYATLSEETSTLKLK